MLSSILRTLLSCGVAVGAVGAMAGGAQADPAVQAGPAPAAAVAPASGTFDIALDAVLGVEPVRGDRCELTATSTLTLSGTVEGSAQGTSTVVIFAPCPQATSAPPGTYFDLFSFDGAFSGTVEGAAATGTISYSGVTRPGGEINNALMQLRGGVWATLRADAGSDPARPGTFVGSYEGVARP